MAKDLSILTTLTLNAAGFNQGIDQAKQKTKALQEGTERAASSVKGSFGNLKGMFTPLTAQLGGLSGGVMDGVQSFKAMVPAINGLKTALIASGIGAIVIGLVAGFSALYTWLHRTDEGNAFLTKSFNIVKAVIETILQKLASLGSAIYKLFTGDFKGAWEDTKDAFTGWGSAMEKSLDKASKLTDLELKQKKINETFEERKALYEANFEKGKTIFDNESSTMQERVKGLQIMKAAQAAYISVEKEKYSIDKQIAQLNLNTLNNSENRTALAEIEKGHLENVKDIEGDRADINDRILKTKQAQALVDKAEQSRNEDTDFLKNKNSPVSKKAKLIAKPEDNGMVKNLIGRQLEEYKRSVFDFDNYNKLLATSFKTLGQSLSSAMGKVSESLAEGGESFKAYAQNLKSAIRKIIGNLIGEAVAHMIASQIKFWAKLGPYGLAAAPVAAAAGAGIVKTLFNTLVPQFENGGIVPGISYHGDNIIARVNSGEMVLNTSQQANLFKMLNNGLLGGKLELSTRISHTDLQIVLSNGARQNNRFR